MSADPSLPGSSSAGSSWSSQDLEQLFRTLPEVFFVVDITQSALRRISPSVERLFGYAPGRVMGDVPLWKRLLLPPARQGDPLDRLRGLTAGERISEEYAVALDDGSELWARANLTLERDEGTGHFMAVGFVSGETPMRNAQRELAALYRISELTVKAQSVREAQQLVLAEIADVMGVPMAMLERYDRERDHLVVYAAVGFATPEDRPLEIPLRQTPSGAALQSGEPVVFPDVATELDYAPGKLGDSQPRFWASFPLSEGGPFPGVVTLVDDAPRRVDGPWIRMGTTLATTLDAFLERLEAGMALNESEGRYRGLTKQLSQANQELESFAYSVSHDLRAPLRTMQGFAHALLQDFGDLLPEEAKDYVQRIVASGRLSEQLITDLLAYSRLSFEELDLKAVDLGSVVGRAREQLEGDLEASGARLSVPEELPTVLGNHTALVQVVANLLSNAVKFVPEERAPVIVIRVEDRGENVRLWVEDNGIGIAEDQAERIFGVFERLTEGGPYPGTGIGLAIVRRGMERIGGACGVERLPEGGSAFWIEAVRNRRTVRRWARWRGNRS